MGCVGAWGVFCKHIFSHSVMYRTVMPSALRRGLSRIRDLLRRPAPHFDLYLSYVSGKAGLEIGGPSQTFRSPDLLPLYRRVGSLDNCDFSSTTIWGDHEREFIFLKGKPAGRAIFCEGSKLNTVAAASYDFVLSSHNLEHFANPVKALHEWRRVLRPGGAVVLILPYYRGTFDHRRSPTPVANMIEDFERNVGEDDLSHLPEILAKHDLALDPVAGTLEAFQQRSADNLNNRCLHHHVFDEQNIRELLVNIGFQVLAVDLVLPMNLCVLAHT